LLLVCFVCWRRKVVSCVAWKWPTIVFKTCMKVQLGKKRNQIFQRSAGRFNIFFYYCSLCTHSRTCFFVRIRVWNFNEGKRFSIFQRSAGRFEICLLLLVDKEYAWKFNVWSVLHSFVEH
jgi:hypothetical protein